MRDATGAGMDDKDIAVMIVEDDPMVMEIIGSYVEAIPGFRVSGQAGSGAAALETIALSPADLIVLDVHLPVMNGVEFLTVLRSQGNPADVIFLTASNDTHIISSALKLGAVDYLIKPFTFERFQAALRNFIRRYRLLNEKGEATQEQLDRMFGQAAAAAVTAPAPIQKGLHPKTLESIRAYIDTLGGAAFSQSDVARHLGLSKVTVRKYMEYLTGIGEVTLHIEYGSVGRPAHTYRRTKSRGE